MNQMLGKPLLGQGINWSHPLSYGLINAWLFNENGGSVIYDIAGGLRGTSSGNPRWLPEGLDFDGSDDYVSIPCPSDVNYLGALTIIVCACIDTGGIYHHFVSKHTGAGDRDTPFSFRTDSDAIPPITLVRGDAAAAFRVYNSSTVKVTLGKYVTYGVTVANGIMLTVPDFYFNGVKIAGTYVGGAGTLQVTGSGADIRLGKRPDDAVKLDGSLKYLYIWNRALPQYEIQQLYIDPYCFIQPIRPSWLKSYVAPAAGIPTHMDYYRRMRMR